MIHVIATIRIQPGKRADFLDLFKKLVPLVIAEDGCLDDGPTIDHPTEIAAQQRMGDDTVVVVERWQSLAHLERHLDAPHMHTFRDASKDLTAGVTLMILEPA